MENQIRYLQNLFYDLLNDYGRAFLIIKYSEKTVIGKRGFTDEEKEEGLVLVFNNRNHKTLQWTDNGSIIAVLGFGAGNRPENCFLHADDIVAVYSPDAGVKLDRRNMPAAENSPAQTDQTEAGKKRNQHESNIVSLDKFRKIKT